MKSFPIYIGHVSLGVQLSFLITRSGKLLLQFQKLVAMNRPSDPDYNSVRNYMEGRSILFEDSSEFIYQREDLVTLRPGRECAWLDAFVERVLKAIRWEPITVCDSDS